jgi:hypothetical protein
MPCTITIDPNVIATQSGGNLTSLVVTGTATECDAVEVFIECGGVVRPVAQAPVNNGQWSASFSTSDLQNTGCVCGGDIRIRVRCNSHLCDDNIITGIKCPPDCPTVSVWATVGSACVDGKREVTLNVFNSSAAGPNSYWSYGNTDPDGAPFSLTNGPHSEQHFYSAPLTYTATLHIQGCPDKTVTFTLQLCPLPVQCPTFVWDDIVPGPCKADGTRSVTVKVTLTWPSTNPVTAVLRQGGTPLQTLTSNSGTLVLMHTGNYAPGSYTLTADVTDPAYCGDASITFDVASCTTGACCLPDGSCQELTKAECEAKGGKYQGDGTTCATVNCNPTSGGDPDPDPDPTPTGGCAGCGSLSLCAILGVIWAIILATFLTLVAAGTLTYPYIIYAGMVVVAYAIFYLIMCGPCQWAKWTFMGLSIFVAALIVLFIAGSAIGWVPAVIIALAFFGVASIAYKYYC